MCSRYAGCCRYCHKRTGHHAKWSLFYERLSESDPDDHCAEITRRRQPPATYTGPAENYQARSELEHYRPLFFNISIAYSDLEKRFQSNDLKKYMEIEDALFSGELNDKLKQYHRLDIYSLMNQLQMLRHIYTTVVGAADCVRDLKQKVHKLFSSGRTIN